MVVALLVEYQPALHGGLLWDDPAHVTRPELRSFAGLWQIWFVPGATQQYYPIAHSAFWLLARVFGDATTGYHVVNVLLHATSAVLVAVILRRLGVRGAVCTAVVFAVHPVHVESVAWITELKNTLSGVLYLTSFLLYLRFDRTRGLAPYAGALVLFVLAILAKSVTATLPAVLLLLFWWMRGRLNVRRDVGPLLPFLVAGGVMGLVTALVERHYIGATGQGFDLNLLERTLLAGRAVCFYLSKLVWPRPLIFVYPRWEVSDTVWWQYLYPLAVLVALSALWYVRRWSRAPLAAVSMFVLTLAPALGFVNVYPFKFSYVADHFQYLASLPILAFGVASLIWLLEGRLTRFAATAGVLVCIGAPLLAVGRAYSHEYSNPEALYRATIAKNPGAWLAYNNLAMLSLDGNPSPKDFADALAGFEKALAIAPREATVQFNVGTALYRMERFDEARGHLRAAVDADPEYIDAWGNLGVTQQKLGEYPAALQAYQRALALKPDLAWVRYNISAVLLELERPADAAEAIAATETTAGSFKHRLALAETFVVQGQFDRAVDQYQRAMAVGQLSGDSLDHLGYALLQLGRAGEAEQHLRSAIALLSDKSTAYTNLGNALQQLGRLQEALSAYRLALATPGGRMRPETHNDFGVALARAGAMEEAAAQFREAVRLNPDFQAARQNLAKALQ